MKKVLVLIMTMLMLSGCFNQEDELKQQYYKYMDKLVDTNAFNKKALPVKVDIFKNNSTLNKFHYEIIISDPEIIMENLQIMALPIDYDFNEVLPNFNVLEKVDITSFNNKQTAIKLNFFSDYDYKDFKVLLVYGSNGDKFESINLFPVKMKDPE